METLSTEAQEADARDRQRFYFHATPLRRFVVFALTWISRLFMQMDVQGLENLPEEGGVVVAANHVNNFDVFPMQLGIPRPIFYMGKAELFKFAPLAAVFRNLGAFPVYRGEKDQWAIRHAARVLEHGQVLGMFPEGTRSRGKGLSVAKTGCARLAIESGCPIVPMAITGADRLLQSFPRRAHVTIRLLPAIQPRPGETPLALTERLMFRLAAALPPAMRGVYAHAPKGFQVD
jgi:1-acyl-sn-glycerol-3-phosphate acyltransferase